MNKKYFITILLLLILAVAVNIFSQDNKTELFSGKLKSIGGEWYINTGEDFFKLNLAPEDFLSENKIILESKSEIIIHGKLAEEEIIAYFTSLIMFAPVAQIAHEKFSIFELRNLIRKSDYAFEETNDQKKPAFMEGIVIKQNRYLFPIEMEYSRGKIVRQEFTEGIEENYLKGRLEKNIIDPSIPITYEYSYAMETV